MLSAKYERRTVLAACLLITGSWASQVLPLAYAKPTNSVELSSFGDFNKGTPEGTMITGDGDVIPGPAAQKIGGVDALLVWSRVEHQSSTYFGTGQPARILEVRASGKPRTLAKLPGVMVTALAVARSGTLLAAVMPGARVFSVDRRTGRFKQLAKLPSKHIWGLVTKGGQLFAAGGAPGKIYLVDQQSGKSSVYYDPGAKHLLFLTQDHTGQLLTGGTPRAILYRVTGKKKGFALHDFEGNELRMAAATKDGQLYVAVNQFPQRTSGIPRFDRKKTSPMPQKGKKKGYRDAELRPGAKSGKGRLFRFDKAGRLDELLALPAGYLTDLVVDRQGVVWAGDGAEGKVYRIKGRQVTTALDLKERQVLAIAVSTGRLLLATGDRAAVYRLTPTSEKAAAYVSRVLDGSYRTRWGNLYYRATRPLTVFSRKGNTKKPDRSWTAWRKAPPKDSRSVSLATKNPARYLQVKLVWPPGDTKGTLRSLKAYYKAQNQHARVTNIKVTTPAVANDGKAPTSRRTKLDWTIKNPDGNRLIFYLAYREELAKGWQVLNEGKAVDKPHFEWSTDSMPDGLYRVRVTLSDERDNAPRDTLRYYRISAPIRVDNQPPALRNLNVRYPKVAGEAADKSSPIFRVEYSVDEKPWRLVNLADGVYDSKQERFSVRLSSKLRRGRHILTIRSYDEAGNLTVGRYRFATR